MLLNGEKMKNTTSNTEKTLKEFSDRFLIFQNLTHTSFVHQLLSNTQ